MYIKISQDHSNKNIISYFHRKITLKLSKLIKNIVKKNCKKKTNGKRNH